MIERTTVLSEQERQAIIDQAVTEAVCKVIDMIARQQFDQCDQLASVFNQNRVATLEHLSSVGRPNG